ncbi:DUF2059 domain-containing protein [Parachitinimonas caeni]|uniref:DUF2059 domain-containing protein n=1 Tax=Parachitinimonas caeni TaxID=3031301 RepID=A0ABT7E3U8_9NEIS|nr:DUF2059 domain-containing protein [Parachitinimonas caeni]MDK2126973.1 DUF2059 domain-containing protein [Parachitinimonas caeni]
MRQFILAGLIALLPLSALAAPPSDKSVEKLLEVTQTKRLVDSISNQVNGMIKPMFTQMMDAQNLPPEKRKDAEQYMDSFAKKMAVIIKDELTWDKYKPIYVKIYKESLTQEDVDGLITFYQSPTGKVVIEKMPLLMQKSVAETQQRMGPMMQKIQKAAEESAQEFKAKQAKK